MGGSDKLVEALARFDSALRQFEAALAHSAEDGQRVEALENEAETLRKDRTRLSHELDLVRAKAGELADTGKNAAGKIDAAMSRIRAVLHSNSPG